MDKNEYKKALEREREERERERERDVLYKRAHHLCSAELLTQYRTKRRELKELVIIKAGAFEK